MTTTSVRFALKTARLRWSQRLVSIMRKVVYADPVILGMLAASTYGQSTSQVFTFAHTSTPLEFQSIANAVRTIGSIQFVSVDAQAKTLAVSGTASQIALADWLFHDLDIDPEGQKPSTQEYTVSGAGDDVARVFYLTSSLTQRDTQEMVNLLRDIGDIRKVMPVISSPTVLLRGTSAQVALGGWLVNTLEGPAAGKSQFVIPGAGDTLRDPGSMVRVFYLAADKTLQAAQDLVNTVRTIAAVSKVYPYPADGAIAMRGHPEQIALAEWLIAMLDRPAASQFSTAAFATSGTQPPAANAVRVFYLPQADTQAAILEAVGIIQANVRIPAFSCSAPRAVAVRGTAAQVLQAESLMAQR